VAGDGQGPARLVSQAVGTGESEWWTLDDPLLGHFLGPYEAHLPVRRS
jgi:hypothetical protein